ncbi:MAG: hypothetical protein LN568_00460 [Rickettsia endosymbiont of Pseudomimeciton antennatum]|nr:hypothetical protein [Rickettsia endosymbiont of Pseudomimeciton antennatum]
MTSPKEPKALKALLIVGPDISISKEIKALFNGRNDCLIIGDGSTAISVKNIESTLKQNNFKITKDTRIDINAHGYRANNKQHYIDINICIQKTCR